MRDVDDFPEDEEGEVDRFSAIANFLQELYGALKEFTPQGENLMTAVRGWDSALAGIPDEVFLDRGFNSLFYLAAARQASDAPAVKRLYEAHFATPVAVTMEMQRHHDMERQRASAPEPGGSGRDRLRAFLASRGYDEDRLDRMRGAV